MWYFKYQNKNVAFSAAISGKPSFKWIFAARSLRINIGVCYSWEKLWEPNGNFCSTVLLLPVLIHLVPFSSRDWAVSHEVYSTAVWVPSVLLFNIQPKLSLDKSAKDLSHLKDNHCCGWLGCSEDPWTGHENKSNRKHTKQELPTDSSQRQTRSWPAQRRKTVTGYGIQMCRQQGTDLSWGHAKCPVMPKILLWFEMLGSATLPQKQTLSESLISSPPSWATWVIPRLCL